MKTKSQQIIVKETEITIINHDDQDYISLTDMIKAKDGNFFIEHWLRNRNTVEFDVIKNQTGLNSFKVSVKEWTEKTNAIGVVAKTGRYFGETLQSAMNCVFPGESKI